MPHYVVYAAEDALDEDIKSNRLLEMSEADSRIKVLAESPQSAASNVSAIISVTHTAFPSLTRLMQTILGYKNKLLLNLR